MVIIVKINVFVKTTHNAIGNIYTLLFHPSISLFIRNQFDSLNPIKTGGGGFFAMARTFLMTC